MTSTETSSAVTHNHLTRVHVFPWGSVGPQAGHRSGSARGQRTVQEGMRARSTSPRSRSRSYPYSRATAAATTASWHKGPWDLASELEREAQQGRGAGE